MTNLPTAVDRIDFADYKADMEQLGAEAKAAIEEGLRQKKALFRLLAAAAISAPDDLVIYNTALANADLYDLTTERDDANDCLRIRVRPRPT